MKRSFHSLTHLFCRLVGTGGAWLGKVGEEQEGSGDTPGRPCPVREEEEGELVFSPPGGGGSCLFWVCVGGYGRGIGGRLAVELIVAAEGLSDGSGIGGRLFEVLLDLLVLERWGSDPLRGRWVLEVELMPFWAGDTLEEPWLMAGHLLKRHKEESRCRKMWHYIKLWYR